MKDDYMDDAPLTNEFCDEDPPNGAGWLHGKIVV